MISEFSWVQISDLHLRLGRGEWSQDVVLRELVRSLGERIGEFPAPHFLIVSGDLAYSGQAQEYLLVTRFLDEIRNILALPRNRVYCVAGNHDIDRGMQRTCHLGALTLLRSPPEVDQFLANTAERETLLQRRAAYREFERQYASDPTRAHTPDGLGYVASLDIMELPICIVGMDSAWMCQGGEADDRKLLVGERQMIDAMKILERLNPRLVVGIVHHPTDWLQRFDQTAFENRILPACDIIHRGHLHEAEVRIAAQSSGRHCAIVAAGAAFESREFGNSYTVCSVNLEKLTCQITTYGYVPRSGHFAALEPQSITLHLRGTLPGRFGDIAKIINSFSSEAAAFTHFLTALILGKKTEIPIRLGDAVNFVNPDLLDECADLEGVRLTREFLALKNILRAYSDNIGIEERIRANRPRIESYCKWLSSIARVDSSFGEEILRREIESRSFAGTVPPTRFANTRVLMSRLCDECDWPALEDLARRQSTREDGSMASEVRRMLALALINSEVVEKKEEGSEICNNLALQEDGTGDDLVFVIAAYGKLDKLEEAKNLVLQGLSKFPEQRSMLLKLERLWR